MTQAEDEKAIANYAHALPDDLLGLEILTRMEDAFAANNTGLFTVATILLRELEARGKASERLMLYRRLLEVAVKAAEDAASPGP